MRKSGGPKRKNKVCTQYCSLSAMIFASKAGSLPRPFMKLRRWRDRNKSNIDPSDSKRISLYRTGRVWLVADVGTVCYLDPIQAARNGRFQARCSRQESIPLGDVGRVRLLAVKSLG